MQEEALRKLVDKIASEKCEGQEIEVKKASKGCPSHLYDTLSSFSNQNSGGIILFGLDEEAGFSVTGVYDVQDLQHRVTQQCGEMNPVVRALFTAVEIEGKMVVAAEIPPVNAPRMPISCTAFLTPVDRPWPKPVRGTLAPSPAKSTSG